MGRDISDLLQRLRGALGSDEAPLLTEEQAELRAIALAQEIDAIGFELQPFHWRNFTPSGVSHPYPAYYIADPRYDLNATGPGEKGQFAINCPGVSCGDLLRLGRACEIKQRLLPAWPKDLRDGLLDPQQHLDTIEEILWLDRFVDVHSVTPKHVQPNGKDADWSFTTGELAIVAEVKNRRRECVGAIDKASRGRDYSSWHADLKGKFSRSSPACFNVACITTYFDPDDALIERAREFLSSGEPVDALIVWSYLFRTHGPVTIFGSRSACDRLSAALAPITREDAFRFIIAEHLERNSEEQRVVTIEEGIAKVLREFREGEQD